MRQLDDNRLATILRQKREIATLYAANLQLQNELRQKLILEDVPDAPETIAGIDVSFSQARDLLYAAVVVLDARTLVPVQTTSVSLKPTFPYVPGLLSFREGPAVLEALSRLDEAPDLLMFDGQGSQVDEYDFSDGVAVLHSDAGMLDPFGANMR